MVDRRELEDPAARDQAIRERLEEGDDYDDEADPEEVEDDDGEDSPSGG
jgi:hypothetical protein